MDLVQEQLKRGPKPDPAARPARRAEILGREAPRRPLAMDPSHPLQSSRPFLSLPLKDGDLTLETEFGNERK